MITIKKSIGSYYRKIYSFIVAFYAFLLLMPYFVWQNSDFIFKIYLLLFLCSFGIYILLCNPQLEIIKIEKNLFIILFTLITLYFLLWLRDPVTSLSALGLISFIFTKPNDLKQIYTFFKNIVGIVYVPGLIGFIFIILGMDLGGEILISPTGRYYKEILASVLIYDNFHLLLRFCSVFYEPGLVGTISALILVVEKFEIKKPVNFLHLLAGICSLSTAFLLISAVSFLLSNRKKLIPYVLLLIVFLFLFIQNEQTMILVKANYLDKLTFLKYSRESKEFLSISNQYFNSASLDEWLLGIGLSNYNVMFSNVEALSWKVILIQFGLIYVIVGISFFIGHLVVYYYHKEIRIYIICFIMSLYQRPDFLTFPYMVMFLGGIMYLAYQYNNKMIRRGNNY